MPYDFRAQARWAALGASTFSLDTAKLSRSDGCGPSGIRIQVAGSRRRWSTMAGHRALTLAAACATAVALLASIAVVGSAEVLERGQLSSISDQHLVRLRLLGSFELLVVPFYPTREDLATALLLGCLAGAALGGGWFLRAPHSADERRLRRFFLLLFGGSGVLMLDELLELSETVAFNAPFLGALPGLRDANDLDLALYPPGAALFVVAFRDVLTRSRLALLIWAAALALLALAIGLDRVTPVGLEEPVEVIASAALVAGFAVLVIRLLRQARAAPALV